MAEGEDRGLNRPKSRRERVIAKLKEALNGGIIFYMTINISMIIIAAINLNQCPVEPNIPKYLLSLGIIGLLSKLIAIFRNCLIKYISLSPFLSILATAELACFIVGSFYVFKEYEPEYDQSIAWEKYCNKTVYLFSFIYFIITVAFLLFIMISIACFVFGIVVVDRYTRSSSSDEESGKRVDVPTVKTNN